MRHPIVLLALSVLTACATESQEDGSAAATETSFAVRAQQQIAAREYQASRSAHGLQAPNRAHALRTYFTPSGIAVQDRVAGTELLSLGLSALGRDGQRAPVAPGKLWSEGTRVEIRRPGLVEWYENSTGGLEQGFTLAERPAGDGALALELSLEGATASQRGEGLVFRAATGRLLEYGHLAAFDAAGRTLPTRFELADAGKVRLVVDDAEAAYPILIDPLLWGFAEVHSNQAGAQLGASIAGAGDVDADGYADLIVGAPFYDAGEPDEGAAFVFLGSADGIQGTSPDDAATQLESNQANARLGASVAAAGDVNGDGYADVIVGARSYAAGQAAEGAAFVFHGGPAGIASGGPASAAAQLESNQVNGAFGTSVAGAGDANGDGYADVIVGADFYSGTFPFSGGAFVFHGSASGVGNGSPATAASVLLNNQSTSRVGNSVAGAGDVNGDGYDDVIVGAYDYDSGQSDEGAAFVFHGSAAGIAGGTVASAATRLEANLGSSFLGWSVAGAGDVNGDGYADVIVGAPSYNWGHLVGQGAAFVFHGGPAGVPNGNATNAPAKIAADVVLSELGASVAGAGDVNGDGYGDVIVGAPRYETFCCAGGNNDGAAYLFLGDETGIGDGDGKVFAYQAPGYFTYITPNNEVGRSVAGVGDVNGDGYADVAIGTPLWDGGQTDEGQLVAYFGGAASMLQVSIPIGGYTSQVFSQQADAELGLSVAGAGDVDGDGYGDVIVGAPGYDAGSADEGAAFLFLGGDAWPDSPDAWETAAAAQLESDQAGARLGASVSGAGDVNGDGHADVIVGAPDYDGGAGADAGAAFVFHGEASGLAGTTPATAAARLDSDQAGAHLGASAAGAGDVNGDGYTDVLVGAPEYDAGESDEGSAFVFHGGPAGIADGSPATAAARFESDQASGHLGYVAGAGDVNRDGFADVLVGAPDYDGSLADEGAAFVLHGSASGVASGGPASAAATLLSAQEGAQLGRGVAGAGDVNGDGYADVIVGAPSFDTEVDSQTYVDGGAAFVFHGGAAGIGNGTPDTAASRIRSDLASAELGFAVAGVGDVNGDGYADVAVGAPSYSEMGFDLGRTLVFEGGATGIAYGTADLEPSEASSAFSDPLFDGVGRSVAGAGDVNGDGYADLTAGGPLDGGSGFGGTVYLYFGNTNGRGARTQQKTPAGAPVAPWGRSGQSDGFVASLQAVHPQGSGLVRGEFEACRHDLDFGAANCVTGLSPEWVAVDGGSPGALLTHTFTGLDEGALYRWRARVLRAPATATQLGITSTSAPAHGPWRRPDAQSVEADIRVIPEPGAVASLACGLVLLAGLARRPGKASRPR